MQAGTLRPVGQGPTFSMGPRDGWVRAPRGLARRVLVSVRLMRIELCYSLSLSLSLSLSQRTPVTVLLQSPVEDRQPTPPREDEEERGH